MKKLAVGIAVVMALSVSTVGFAAAQKQAPVRLADNMPAGEISALPGAVPPPAGITPAAQPNQGQAASTSQSSGSSSNPIPTPNTTHEQNDSTATSPSSEDDDND